MRLSQVPDGVNQQFSLRLRLVENIADISTIRASKTHEEKTLPCDPAHGASAVDFQSRFSHPRLQRGAPIYAPAVLGQ